MSDILGFEFHKGDRVCIKKDGRLATVTKSYCNMTGWCDEFRVVVKFFNPVWGERDFAAAEVEKCDNGKEAAK